MIIERTQKQIFFELATREGIINDDLLSIPDIYQRLLGVQDLGQARYGLPMTQAYPAKPNYLIDVDRIRTFFESLHRDHTVIDHATWETENYLVFLNLEVWSRLQRVKNRAMYVSRLAEAERVKASLNALWSHTETFNQTDMLDMTNTTAWIDSSTGTATLPSIGAGSQLHPSRIKVESVFLPKGSNSLGSTANEAIDGIGTTNWRVMFSATGRAEAVFLFDQPIAIVGLNIDPVGFGLNFEIQTENNEGVWTSQIKDLVYRRTTYPVGAEKIRRLKILFEPGEAILPRVTGLRELSIMTGQTANNAIVLTKILKPAYPFSELRIQSNEKLGPGSSISYSYSNNGSVWQPITNNDWTPVNDSSAVNLLLTDANEFSGAALFNGVFSIPVSRPTNNVTEGTLEVGLNQIEVSTFRRDWSENGVALKELGPTDFENQPILKTWTSISPKTYSEISYTTTSVLAQNYGGTIWSAPYGFERGQKLAMARKFSNVPYEEFTFIPLSGNNSHNTLQYGFNYRIRFKVHATRDVAYESGRFWLLQGYKTPNSPRNTETARSYGTFVMYINGQRVASQTIGHTVYSDGSMENSGSLGTGWILRLNKGWNDVEIYIYVIDPAVYGSDRDQLGDPYLQLSIYPSFFDNKFQIDQGIDQILASGQVSPSTEFDLIWNLPKEPTFWAWANDRNHILFNTKRTQPIDGFLVGQMPTSNLVYRGTGLNSLIDNLYIRAELLKDNGSLSMPVLEDFTVFVR